MDILTKEQRRKNMRAIKSTGSKEELLLAKTLWHKGYRYRKNDRTVEGKPDLTFKKYKIAIFVDSEFFHGKNWQAEKYRIKSNRDFWWEKIEQNIKRDQFVNKQLKDDGWIVLRFWSNDIRKNLTHCISIIESVLSNQNENI